MAKRPLTDIAIRRLKARAATYEKRDHGAQALRVAVQPSGHKSFVSRFRIHGKPAKLTHGSVLTLPLIEARKRDAEAMRELAAGRDPRLSRLNQPATRLHQSRVRPRPQLVRREQAATHPGGR
jgi:hypothetical protein